MTFDIYAVITDKIIASLESGNIPWLKPWKNKDANKGTIASMPFNGFSGRNYNGMNLLLLGCTDFNNNAWYSFKQVKELGGNVKSGQKSTMVTFWSITEKTNKDGKPEKHFFLKYYNVFNFEQCENLPAPKNAPIEFLEYNNIDGLVSGLGIGLNHGGDRAFYAPSRDSITMPTHTAFNDENAYKATLLHELTHATGHESRCDRDKKNNRFGNEGYAFEELVAELGSAFLSVHFSVEPSLQHNAAYIQSWLKVLKDDKKAIITASSQATKACQWVLTQLAMPLDEPMPMAA